MGSLPKHRRTTDEHMGLRRGKLTREQTKADDAMAKPFVSSRKQDARLNVKRCCHCEAWMTVEHFNRDRARRDGLFSRCRMCEAESHLTRIAGRAA